MQTPNPQTPTWNAAPQPQPASGQHLLLGRYRVVETRGTGAFASVWVCWDIRLQRRVAIKCLPLAPSRGIEASTLQEALTEARITSRLVSPNIVTVHDFELAGNCAYLIMEYVDGLTLAEFMARVEDGTLTGDECAHLLSSLSKALSFAHEEDVYHLDIKPSNILIDATGTIKLGDFGMANLANAAGLSGARGGTVGYMPPEQIKGTQVDERTDLFSLATVCYEALTGSNPFLAAGSEVSLRKIEQRAKPLARVRPELAGPVSDAVARAISPLPAQRQASVQAFANSVLPYLGDEQQGRASIARLMDQARNETGPDELAWQAAANVRPSMRWPWLRGVCARATSSLVSGLVAWHLMPTIIELFEGGAGQADDADPSRMLARIALVLLPAALAFLSPKAGGVVSSAIIVVAVLACDVYSTAFLAAILIGVIIATWWRHTGGEPRLAPAALLLPASLLCPAASAGLAAALFAPVAAATTAVLGAALAFVARAVVQANSGGHIVDILLALLRSQTAWLLVAASGAAAWLGSLLSRRGSKGKRIVGQFFVAGIVGAAQINVAGVENGGIWQPIEAANIAVAVLCLVLMSIAIVTFGPTPTPREDE